MSCKLESERTHPQEYGFCEQESHTLVCQQVKHFESKLILNVEPRPWVTDSAVFWNCEKGGACPERSGVVEKIRDSCDCNRIVSMLSTVCMRRILESKRQDLL